MERKRSGDPSGNRRKRSKVGQHYISSSSSSSSEKSNPSTPQTFSYSSDSSIPSTHSPSEGDDPLESNSSDSYRSDTPEWLRTSSSGSSSSDQTRSNRSSTPRPLHSSQNIRYEKIPFPSDSPTSGSSTDNFENSASGSSSGTGPSSPELDSIVLRPFPISYPESKWNSPSEGRSSSSGSYRSGTPNWIRSSSDSSRSGGSRRPSSGLSRGFSDDENSLNASTPEANMPGANSPAPNTPGGQPAPNVANIDEEDIQFLGQQNPSSYEITRLLTMGAFGRVYLGRRQPENTDCAVKILKPGELNASAHTIEVEVNNIQHVMTAPHRYVLEFYGVFSNQALGRAYICSEYSAIGDIYNYMSRTNAEGVVVWEPLDQLQARYLIKCIAQGIHHLHTIGIAHGDVKPENILLFERQNIAPAGMGGTTDFTRLVPKMTDFSASIRRSDTDPPNQIWFLVRMCTINYAAPETDEIYDMIKADTYSVGCVLLAMLLGARPFDPPIQYVSGNQPQDIQQRSDYNAMCTHMKSSNEYLNHICSAFDISLKEVLRRILEPNPELRITLNEFVIHKWFDTRGSGLLRVAESGSTRTVGPRKRSL